jgi:hypothetical protein
MSSLRAEQDAENPASARIDANVHTKAITAVPAPAQQRTDESALAGVDSNVEMKSVTPGKRRRADKHRCDRSCCNHAFHSSTPFTSIQPHPAAVLRGAFSQHNGLY